MTPRVDRYARHLRTIAPYLALAAATLFWIVFVLKLPLARLDVPYTTWGDAVDKIAQIETVAETGWLFHNDRLGYPFGYDRLDFPRFDSLNYVIMGPIAAVTGSAGLAINLYFLAGFFLIGFAALYALRRLGLTNGPAFIASLLYAFQSYHVLRGVHHVTNGAYFLVPLGMLVLVRIGEDRLDFADRSRRRLVVGALVVAFLMPLQTPYNGVFFAYLCMVAGLLAIARRGDPRAAIPAAGLMVAVAAAFLIEQLPYFVHQVQAGFDTATADRPALDAETYSLHLNQLLVPTIHHRWSLFRTIAIDFDRSLGAGPPYLEYTNQYIGLFGVAGLLALLWALARAVAMRAPRAIAPSDRALEPAVRICAMLAIAILAFAMSSGLCTMIAFAVTAKIRAYNRILPFLAFPCLLAGGWILQGALRRIGSSSGRFIVMAVVGVLALLDATSLPLYSNHARAAAAQDADQAYFSHVESVLSRRAAVFQLPVVYYPEHPPMRRMPDYAEFKPFLFTESLRFSYGSAQTRLGYEWGRYVEALSPDQQTRRLRELGFSALLVDAYAYDEADLAKLRSGLASVLPSRPLVSADGRWLTFPLQGCCSDVEPRTVSDGDPPTIGYRSADGTLDFSRHGMGWIYGAVGWSTPEDWGTWSVGKHSVLRMRLDSALRGAILVDLRMRAMVGPKLRERHVRIAANGRRVADLVYTLEQPIRQTRILIPEGIVDGDGTLELAFDVERAATPVDAGVNDDPRRLGVGLETMSLRARADPRDAR